MRPVLLATLILALPGQAQGLLVSGTLLQGAAHLEPAFHTEQAGEVPPAGAHTLELLDGAGQVLGRVPFEPAELADLPPGCTARSFVLVLPVTAAVQKALAGLRWTAQGATLATLRASNWQAGTLNPEPAPLAQEPRATALGQGRVRLAWDPRAHPKVMVRNDGGEIIAMGQGGALDLLTASAGLTVELSDGLRSVKRWVRVEPR